MDWTSILQFALSWIGFGVIGFALSIINLIRVSGGHTAGSQAFVFGSLSCGALALLDEYRRADAMVKAGDLETLGNTINWTCTMLMVACFLLIILNLLCVAICMGVNAGRRRQDRKALNEAQRQAAEAVQRAAAAEQRASTLALAENPPAEEWKQMSEDNAREAEEKAEKEKIQAELAENLTGEGT